MEENSPNKRNKIADFVLKVGRLIPGFASYENKESIRENDHKIRIYCSENLKSASTTLNKIKQTLGDEDDDVLLNIDKVQAKIRNQADRMIYAKHGYSDLFDKSKEGEFEKVLLSLVDHDQAVLDLSEGFLSYVKEAGASDINLILIKLEEIEVALNNRSKTLY